MSCIYHFNGKTYSSELELDEELLKLKRINPKVLDVVYSKYSERSNQNHEILTKASEDATKFYNDNFGKLSITAEDIKTWTPSEHLGVDDGIKNCKDYVSVTSLMLGLLTRGTDGKLHPVFPIWNSDEYWSHMEPYLTDMTNRINTPEGKQFLNLEFLDALFNEENAKPRNILKTDLERYRKRMEEGYWPSLALVGTVSHKILRLAFVNFFDLMASWTPTGLVALLKTKTMTKKDGFQSDDNSIKAILDSAKKHNNGHSICDNEDEFLLSVANSAIELTKRIRKQYPKNPRVYCELRVMGDPTKGYSPLKILGMIDLIVIDDDCNVGIFDYKCSPKLYSKFDSAKKRTFMYLLAIYRRLVKKLGIIHSKEIAINVVPLQFINFSYDDGDGNPKDKGFVKVSGILANTEVSKNNIIKDLDAELDPTVEQNLNLVIDMPTIELDNDNITSNVKTFMSLIAPDWADFRDVSTDKMLEKVTTFIEKYGGITKSANNTDTYIFNYQQINKIIEGKSDEDVIAQVMEIWLKAAGAAKLRASNLQTEIIKAKEAGRKFTHRSIGNLRDASDGTYNFVENALSKYGESQWEVVTKNTSGINPDVVDILLNHGMLLFRNTHSNTIDVIKVSSARTELPVLLGPSGNRRRYIQGTFISDDDLLRDTRNPPLESIEGNFELMESLALLNYIPKTLSKLGTMIGEIKVINSDGYSGIGGLDAPSELLVKNFRKLWAFAGLKNCQIDMPGGKGNINLCTHYDLVTRELNAIKSKNVGYSTIADDVLNLADAFHNSVINNFNKEVKLLNLQKLQQTLEKCYPNLKGKPITELDYTAHPEYKIYNEVLLSIAELSGVNLVLQIRSHPKYFGDLRKILTEGVHGSRTDNPGRLESLNLNNLTYLTERAYLNVRSTTAAFNQKLRKAVAKLKKSKNFSAIDKYTLGNQASLYTNLYDKDAKNVGELRLKPLDHSSLNDSEKEFLEFAIRKFAYDRGIIEGFAIKGSDGTFQEDLFQLAYTAHKELLLLVPLTRADFSSMVASSGGLFRAITNVFKLLLPANLKQFISGKFYELLNSSADNSGKSEKDKAKAGEVFEMINRVKNSYNSDLRKTLLTPYNSTTKQLDNNTDLYEINLEKLLLYSDCSTAMEVELNKVFPSIKAIIASLSMQGAIQNTKFTDDVEYALAYIKNKILGLPLEDIEQYGLGHLAVTELMSGASKLALAFNPMLLYLVIDGLWKDLLLIMQKPDVDLPEESAFTKQHMKDSFLWILSDVTAFGDRITLGEALNNVYGLNDRDINVYTDRINSDTAGIFNFWSLGFRFASRPDYYNRMTIFGALMRKDGSFEAHHMENDRLVYDWTKDKRFEAFAKGDTSNPDYSKQKALYLAMANEFIAEGARNADGSLFQISTTDKPTALPRAYTTKQSESMKALGDKIYGYYTHEKKSMILSYTIGALFMQMHTYWSAKKNLYLAGHGYTQEGEFVQFSEQMPDGTKKLYYTDEEGNPTETNTGVPYMVWEGRPSEGIIVTLGKLASDLFYGEHDESGKIVEDENGNRKVGWGYMFDKNFGEHADLRLRAIYRANLTRLAYDLGLWLLVGSILSPALTNVVEEYMKEHKNNNLLQASINTTLLGSAKMFKSSSDDFNFINSLFGQAVTWDPFALSMMRNVVTQSRNLFNDEKDSFDTFVNIMSATRNTKPMWDYVKFTTTGRFIGESKEK